MPSADTGEGIGHVDTLSQELFNQPEQQLQEEEQQQRRHAVAVGPMGAGAIGPVGAGAVGYSGGPEATAAGPAASGDRPGRWDERSSSSIKATDEAPPGSDVGFGGCGCGGSSGGPADGGGVGCGAGAAKGATAIVGCTRGAVWAVVQWAERAEAGEWVRLDELGWGQAQLEPARTQLYLEQGAWVDRCMMK